MKEICELTVLQYFTYENMFLNYNKLVFHDRIMRAEHFHEPYLLPQLGVSFFVLQCHEKNDIIFFSLR